MSKKLEFGQFGISRQTGYKWLKRFREEGYEGLEEQSRRPKSSPLSFGEELVAAVLDARDAHPSWGATKLRGVLVRRFGDRTPGRSTIARMLKRFGRIRKKRRRCVMSVIEAAPNEAADTPNAVWTVDFKGWWLTLDGSKCEPLTVRDAHSRYVLAIKLTNTSTAAVKEVFEELFRKHGLPSAIQCDNGSPFVSVKSRGGMSRLSAWWVSLGIRLVRSRPGCPQDNGAHERMHRDIAIEVESTPARTLREQQTILDKWRQEFNHVRPHDALDGKTPSELYVPSARRFVQAPHVYPQHFTVRRVSINGVIWMAGDHYFIGAPFGSHRIGLQMLDEVTWRIWFAHVDCGTIEIVPRHFEDFASRKTPAQQTAESDATLATGTSPLGSTRPRAK
jgi:transposase InsO family protein